MNEAAVGFVMQMEASESQSRTEREPGQNRTAISFINGSVPYREVTPTVSRGFPQVCSVSKSVSSNGAFAKGAYPGVAFPATHPSCSLFIFLKCC